MNQTEKTPRFARTPGEGLNESLLKVARVEHCLKDEWSHGSVVSTNAVCGLLEHGFQHTPVYALCPDWTVCFFSPFHHAYRCCNKRCISYRFDRIQPCWTSPTRNVRFFLLVLVVLFFFCCRDWAEVVFVLLRDVRCGAVLVEESLPAVCVLTTAGVL